MANAKSRSLVIHPLLFAAAPILILYKHNIDQVPAGHMLPPLAASVAITGVLWLVLRALLGSSAKSGLVVSTLLALFFSYGHLHGLSVKALIALGVRRQTGGVLPLEESVFLNSFLTVVTVIAAAFLIYRIVRAGSPPVFANELLNLIGAILVAMPLVGMARYAIASPSLAPDRSLGPSVAGKEAGLDPDIYYLILDGYGRADVLADDFNYDNSEFLAFLKASGFIVSDGSRSNYSWTFLSLASSLNMDYLDALAGRMGRTSQDYRPAYEMIRDSRVVQMLRARGYRYVHFDSTWGATQSSPRADVEVAYRRGGFSSEFYRLLLTTTLLRSAPAAQGIELATRHLYGLDKLRSACRLPGPKFVFYHVLPPHHPYVFDRQGNVKRHAFLSNQFEFEKQLWRERGQYLDQLAFVSGKIRLAIADILRCSPRPPVIILQSDHGPTLTDVPQDEGLRARLSILNAVYLPPGTEANLPAGTPVNTFRALFDALFGSGLPLLEDRSYYSPYERPYDFREVTPPQGR